MTNNYLKTLDKVTLPQTRRFILSYTKEDGKTEVFEVSNPIDFDEKNQIMKFYSFNRHHIRGFKIAKITSMKEIKIEQVIV